VQNHYIYTARDINEYTINKFRTYLSYETWDCVFDLKNNPVIDTLFSTFLNNYLRIFYNHFPKRKFVKRLNYTPWMTLGIRTSCKHKRLLYLYTKSCNGTSLKRHYKQCCKIVADVIKEAKTYTYNTQIIKSTNKIKTTWNIIKRENNRHKKLKNVTNYENSLDAFNNYI